MSLKPGVVVDRYLVQDELGRGGMATVYRVQHTSLGTIHALKVLDVHSADIRDRMLLEGRIQANLQHVNIVAVTDVVDVDGAPGLIMEFIDGAPLDAFLAGHRPSPEQIDGLARGILTGVAAAHDRGLVHRDLKPGNVLLEVVNDTLVPKITDFGLAKVLQAKRGAHATRTGVAMGSPAYMAPEQIHDSSNVDHRADIWSLGVLLYELVTGRRPFAGTSPVSVLDEIRAEALTPPSAIATVPQRMERAIMGALVIDPDQRIASCSELLEIWAADTEPLGATDAGAIQRVLDLGSNPDTSLGTWQATEPPQSAEPPAPADATSRLPWLVMAGGFAVLLVGALLGERMKDANTPKTAYYGYIEQRGYAVVGVEPLDPDNLPLGGHHRVLEVKGRLVESARMNSIDVDYAGDFGDAPALLTYEYDKRARLTRIVEPDPYGGTRSETRVVAEGDTVTYATFDAVGRPMRRVETGAFGEVFTLREDGWPARVDFKGPEGERLMSDDTTWGFRFEYDDRGRQVATWFLGSDGSDDFDQHGIAVLRRRYDHPKFPFTQSRNWTEGVGGVEIQENGCATFRVQRNDRYEIVSMACENRDGEPTAMMNTGCEEIRRSYARGRRDRICVQNGEPAHIWRHDIDDRGFLTRRAFFDVAGEPTEGPGGFHSWNYTIGDRGEVRLVSRRDRANKRVYDRDGVADERYRYNDRGHIVEKTYLDLDGRPTLGPDGWATQKRRSDETGRKTSDRLYDASGEPVIGNKGWHEIRFEHDRFEREVRNTYFDASGEPISVPCAAMLWETDPAVGVRSSRRVCLGVDGERMVDPRTGWAEQKSTHDQRARRLAWANFGADGEGTADRHGIEAVRQEWGVQGGVKSQRFVDHDGGLRSGPGGYARVEIDLDARGNQLEIAYFGPSDKPVAVEGCARVESTFDALDRATSKRCFSPSGAKALTDGLAHQVHFVYHLDSSLIVREEGRDAAGELVAVEETTRDERGLVTEVLNHRGDVRSRHASSYDERGRLADESWFSEDDTAVVDAERGYHRVAYEYDVYNRVTAERYFGVDGQPDNPARQTTRYDRFGRQVENAWFDAGDAPFERNGVARRVKTWDSSGNLSGTIAYDAADNVVSGAVE